MAKANVSNPKPISKALDLTGKKFNRLLVLEQADHKNGHVRWKCRCDCGKEVIVKGIKLKRGQKSCGCFGRELNKEESLIGLRFGRLTVLERDLSKAVKPVRWLCKCECGNKASVAAHCLRSGHTTSCGCFQRESAGKANVKHGQANKSPEYLAWKLMRARCNNPNAPRYKDYGGRGISVCSRWDDFANFLADMGPKPSPTHSLDRWPDTNGPYSPANCRWATRKEQNRNTRRNVYVEIDGEKYVAKDAAVLVGAKPSNVHWRLKRGHSLDKAFSKTDLRTREAKNGCY